MATETVFERFRATATRWPDRPFFNVLAETAQIYGIAPGSWSYGDALADVEALAAAYRAAGYGPGLRVGLLLQNRPDFLRHWLALNAIGAGLCRSTRICAGRNWSIWSNIQRWLPPLPCLTATAIWRTPRRGWLLWGLTIRPRL